MANKKSTKPRGRPAKPALTPGKVEIISREWARGSSLRGIADLVGVSHTTVLEAIRRQIVPVWREALKVDLAEELAKLAEVEREAWAGWIRSQEDRETHCETTAGDGSIEHSSKREGQAGSPAFLKRIHDCIATRCKLLGIEPPRRIDVGLAGPRVAGKEPAELDAETRELLVEAERVLDAKGEK